MPRAFAQKGKKVSKAKRAEEADTAVLRAQLELARAERARADEKIHRLEKQLFGKPGTSCSDSDTASSDSDAAASETSSPSSDAGCDVREAFLDRLLAELGDGFPAAIRKSAQEALRDGPQKHPPSRKGCNWIGGIQLSWTSPPVVQDVKPHVQEHFPRPIQPGDLLNEVDGKSVNGLSRGDILGLLKKFKGSVGFKRASHADAIRQSADEALQMGPQQDDDCTEGQNWIWGICFAWTSPPVVREVKPEVQVHFPTPITPGDVLHQVDGKHVSKKSRAEVLQLLRRYKGSIGFKGCKRDDVYRKSAEEALKSGPQPDAESGKGCDWIGGILLAWTSPPVVRDAKPEVQQHFQRGISPGDVLHTIDGKKVQDLSRTEILKLLQKHNGSLCFRSGCDMDADVRRSAQKALKEGPQSDEESGKGCDWIGGILLAWTSPPVVRDAKPEVQKHFPKPISPGDILRQIDGKHVQGLSRLEILRLLQDFKGSLGFRSGNDMDADVRRSAQEALKEGPQEDEQSQKGCNWIGGILLAWTSPPVVRDVKPSVQKHFQRPISPGDVLHSVDRQQVKSMSRTDILRALTVFDGGLGFRAAQACEVSLVDLLRRLEEDFRN